MKKKTIEKINKFQLNKKKRRKNKNKTKVKLR